MTHHPALDTFLAECQSASARGGEPADIVIDLAPKMMRLLREKQQVLDIASLRSDPAHYCRNALYVAPDESLSLYALVWLPGQWTPVHDHGSWGVVGVVSGVLEERAYMCPHGEINGNDGIHLKRGGTVLLDRGSVTTFVPNPDHIHMTGVDANRERAVSLHLYGRNMNSFHIYDLAQGTRRLIDVPHHQT